ncbi:isopentenyl-diphosphate Delta-isomerase [Rapidithrix thailandica]|uniref:Isopentenyl-diphosphate delta-isomerase n=1 Tax=Rapidithrix thailandica TaxID=413964 RepID=A0AAW9SA38_9BACT
MEQVILVDQQDNAIGNMEKMEAHRKGLLHRAFSVLIFNTKGEMLIHQRARGKYHSGGLWTNACCSHPWPGEKMEDAVKRRLKFEMGFETEMQFVYKFTYQTSFSSDLHEHEVDHVFIGTYDDAPEPNPAEVEAWKYISLKEVQKDILKKPELYTSWFKLIMDHDFIRERMTKA